MFYYTSHICLTLFWSTTGCLCVRNKFALLYSRLIFKALCIKGMWKSNFWNVWFPWKPSSYGALGLTLAIYTVCVKKKKKHYINNMNNNYTLVRVSRKTERGRYGCLCVCVLDFRLGSTHMLFFTDINIHMCWKTHWARPHSHMQILDRPNLFHLCACFLHSSMPAAFQQLPP